MFKYSLVWCMLPVLSWGQGINDKNITIRFLEMIPGDRMPEYYQYYYMRYENFHLYCEVTAPIEVDIYWYNRYCKSYDKCSENEPTKIELAGETFSELLNDTLPNQYITYLRVELARSDIFECRACIKNTDHCKGQEVLLFAMPDWKYPNEFKNKSKSEKISCLFEDEVQICHHQVISQDNLTIACRESKEDDSTDGADISFNWTLKDKNITLDYVTTRNSYYSTYNLTKVTLADSGNYTCRKSLSNSTTIHYVEVLEDSLPVIDKSPTMWNETIVRPQDQAKDVMQHCHAKGIPPPTFEWYYQKDDKADRELISEGPNIRKIQSENNNGNKKITESKQYRFEYTDEVDYELNYTMSTLIIKELTSDLVGNYICRAVNRMSKLNPNVFVEATSNISLETGTILWYILFAILFLLLIIFGVLYIYTYLKERRHRKELEEAGLLNFERGNPDFINPDMNLSEQADNLPYNRKFEFARHKLKMGKQLGQGAFGVVVKAEADGILEENLKSTVAVKMVKQNIDLTHVKALASELKIMIHLGKHVNVVNLLGACTDNLRDLLVIVEYCPYGNLHSFLQRHRPSFINQVNCETGIFDPTVTSSLPPLPPSKTGGGVKFSGSTTQSTQMTGRSEAAMLSAELNTNEYHDDVNCHTPQMSGAMDTGSSDAVVSDGDCIPLKGSEKVSIQSFCTQDLICWSFQVARGMEYLSSRKVLHGDLAARNILLSDRNTIKISDFGLSKNMYNYKCGNYLKKSKGMLPVRWMALEAIRDGQFSTQSDVWAYGIVLWEFFSLARTPYPLLDDAEKMFRKLEKGYRMEKPMYATNDLYELMMACWDEAPSNRPLFNVLVEKTSNMLEESVRKYYTELNDPYMEHNKEYFANQEDYLHMLFNPSAGEGAGSSSEGYMSMDGEGKQAMKEKLEQMTEDYMSMEGRGGSGEKRMSTSYTQMGGGGVGGTGKAGEGGPISGYTEMDPKSNRYVEFPLNRPVSEVQEKTAELNKELNRYIDFPINKPVANQDSITISQEKKMTTSSDEPKFGKAKLEKLPSSKKSEPQGVHYVNLQLDGAK